MPVVFARCRLPAWYLGLALVVIAVGLRVAHGQGLWVTDAESWVFGVGALFLALAAVMTLWAPVPRVDATVVELPVQGNWIARRSPASRIPSHGSHAWGRAYGLDLVYAPGGAEWWSTTETRGAFLGPGRFASFGQPVCAPADGLVVHVTNGHRDHKTRLTWVGRLWYWCERPVRSILGPHAVLGNHVVIRIADGSHLVLAHLRQGSIRVRTHDTVSAGAVVASCGNSGSSSQPHVHVHLQDVESPYIAMGLPWAIAGHTMPPTGEPLVPDAKRPA